MNNIVRLTFFFSHFGLRINIALSAAHSRYRLENAETVVRKTYTKHVRTNTTVYNRRDLEG